jgi:hypothetical protein
MGAIMKAFTDQQTAFHESEKSGATKLSTDPADYDGRRPWCQFCTDNHAVVRTVVGAHLLCDECFQDWLNGRYDESSPDVDGAS